MRHSPFATLGQVDEWLEQRFLLPWLFVEILLDGLWLLKHWIIRIAYKHWSSNFPKGGMDENQNTVIAFLAAEKKNGQLEDLPQADFGRVPEKFLLSVRTKAIAELGDWEMVPAPFLYV